MECYAVDQNDAKLFFEMGKWLRSTVRLEENDQYQLLFGKRIAYACIILIAYHMHIWAPVVAQLVKNPPATQETWV